MTQCYCFFSSRRKIPQIIRKFEIVAGETLDDFIDGIKQDRAKDSILPDDCTVHEINSNGIHFLQSLLGKLQIWF